MGILSKIATLITVLLPGDRKDENYDIVEKFRQQGAIIGSDCYFGTRTLGSEPYLIEIGDHVQVSSNVQFLTHNPGWCFRNEIPDLQSYGKIVIGDNSYLGACSIILPSVTIGANCLVAAGAVVTKDVSSGSVVAGNPARIISSIEKYRDKVVEMWRLQKPEGYIPELRNGEQYSAKYVHSLFRKPENRQMLKKHLLRVLK